MALIDRVKARVPSDLADAELQAMIDAITAEIEARFGAAGPVTETLGDFLDAGRWRRTLRLNRAIDASQPVEIVELDPGNTGQAVAETTLAAADYRILHGGRTLQRLTGGPNANGFWAPLVRITYTPRTDQAAREEVTIKIIQLDLSYRGGLKSERAGDYSFTLGGADLNEEREKLLASLGRQGFVMA